MLKITNKIKMFEKYTKKEMIPIYIVSVIVGSIIGFLTTYIIF